MCLNTELCRKNTEPLAIGNPSGVTCLCNISKTDSQQVFKKKENSSNKICSCHSNWYLMCLQLCHVTETVSDLCRNAVNSWSIKDTTVVKSEPKRGMFYSFMNGTYCTILHITFTPKSERLAISADSLLYPNIKQSSHDTTFGETLLWGHGLIPSK